MKNILFILAISYFLISCSNNKKYEFDKFKTKVETDSIMDKILPYMGKLPKGVIFETRFNTEFAEKYQIEKINKKYQFEFYHIEADTHYFFCSRIAPSLYQKRIGIVGKFTLTNDKKIQNYEELFWTFKMPENDLKQKGLTLFTKMLQKEDLSSYYRNINSTEEWIEFPDDLNYYDKTAQKWVFKY